MKYYKDPDGAVFAFESDGSQDECIDAGFVLMTDAEVQEHLYPTPTPDQISASKVATVRAFMDGKARELKYDDIATAVTYADEPAIPKFQAEGQAFRTWRSLVWERCYEILQEVQDGTRPIPSDEELIAELPDLNLPGA